MPFFSVVARLLEIPSHAGRNDLLVASVPPPDVWGQFTRASPNLWSGLCTYPWNGVRLPWLPPTAPAGAITYNHHTKCLRVVTPNAPPATGPPVAPPLEPVMEVMAVDFRFGVHGRDGDFVFHLQPGYALQVGQGMPESLAFHMSPLPGGGWLCVCDGWDDSIAAIIRRAAHSTLAVTRLATRYHALLLVSVISRYVRTMHPFRHRPLTLLCDCDDMCTQPLLRYSGVFSRRARTTHHGYTRLETW